ncbi:hypothetical protein BDN71DRAFT_1447569 [Pleurotus eryngii]|uniref:Uncharacterized protein n=1 Tax=Pleurotus eryngii TaxID=5323 RepID=A0A9P5ZZB1_PLEER|nr:hypothetical protein BDN71DRAFT_1447569 [Pleurotus eryngii]
MVGMVVVAPARKFKVVPGLRRRYTHFKLLYQGSTDNSGVNTHLSSLKKEHPLAGDRAVFPRRRSARMAVEACAWLTTSPENWESTVGNTRW